MTKDVIVLNERQVGVRRRPAKAANPDRPLIVALHGGTYSSAYFDIDGYSLLHQAEALDFPILAIDRPGYGDTLHLSLDELSHEGNGKVIERIIGDYWAANAGSARGVFLIGHSIGGAIAAAIAARRPSWPLLGIAISGVALHHSKDNSADLKALSGGTHVNMPPAFKDAMMFGPVGIFHPDAPDRLRAADAPAPIQDIVDIVRTWPAVARDILARIDVPVHYRQAEFDALWKVDEAEIQAFAQACASAPWIDAGIFRNTGHCIDLHRVGSAFQLEQLAFAIKCSVAASCQGVRPQVQS